MSVNRSFERTMTKSSPKCLTIPAGFVRKFGHCLHKDIRVKMASDTRLWKVKINVYFMKKQPHVSFGTGWKQFMRANLIFQGQTVKLTLTGTSVFEVSRVTNSVVNLAPVRAQRGLATRRSSRLPGGRINHAPGAHRNRKRHRAPAHASEIIVIDE